jgi:hypothetical protein
MKKRIVVTVHQAALGGIDQVAQALTQAGMTVDQILSTTGIITGSADHNQMSALGAVPGIAAVEPDTDFQIPPDGPQ